MSIAEREDTIAKQTEALAEKDYLLSQEKDMNAHLKTEAEYYRQLLKQHGITINDSAEHK